MKAIRLASLSLLLTGCSLFDSNEHPFAFPDDTSTETQRDPELDDYPSFVREQDDSAEDD